MLERLQFVNYFWQGSKYTSDLYNFRFSLSCKCDDSKSVVHRGSVTKVFFSTFQNSKESTFDGVIFSVKCHTYIHNFSKTDTSHVFSLHFAKLYRTILYSVWKLFCMEQLLNWVSIVRLYEIRWTNTWGWFFYLMLFNNGNILNSIVLSSVWVKKFLFNEIT